MSVDPTKAFLGSGIAFPFRTGGGGLPELVLANGEDLVEDVINFLLRTTPGDLPWDPELGLDPEVLRFDPTDLDSAVDARTRIERALAEGEPRLADVEVETRREPSRELLDVGATFRVIESPTPENDVRLPQRGQQDVLRAAATRIPIQGHFRSVTIIPGTGTTGSE